MWGQRERTILGPRAMHREEVDDTGGEVQCHQGFSLQHAHAVAVTIAGAGHATAEDDEVLAAQGEEAV